MNILSEEEMEKLNLSLERSEITVRVLGTLGAIGGIFGGAAITHHPVGLLLPGVIFAMMGWVFIGTIPVILIRGVRAQMQAAISLRRMADKQA
jgi:hypothetical protein